MPYFSIGFIKRSVYSIQQKEEDEQDDNLKNDIINDMKDKNPKAASYVLNRLSKLQPASGIIQIHDILHKVEKNVGCTV
jgi:hypothetical protein